MGRIWNWRGWSILALVCSGLLFLVSVCLLWRTYSISRTNIADEGAFRLEKRSIDGGKARIGQPVKCTFRLFNMSSETRHVLKVVPGCSCTKVAHFSKDVAPQSWGEVTVSIDTTGHPGLRQSSVLITTDDVKRSQLNPLVSCEVLPSIGIKPQRLQVVLQQPTADFTAAVEVAAFLQDEKVTLGDIQASDPAISATKETIEKDRKYRLHVAVSKDVAAGITLAQLDIQVKGSAQKTVRLPITIENEKVLRAEPSSLSVEVDKEGALRTIEFTVRSPNQGRVDVKKVELAGAALPVVQRRVADNAMVVRLEDVKMRYEFHRKHICVTTNHGELRIPVKVVHLHKHKKDATHPPARVSESVGKNLTSCWPVPECLVHAI